MSELREAAKEALRWMEHARLHLTIKERMHPDGLSLYDSAAEALRAALAQPKTELRDQHKAFTHWYFGLRGINEANFSPEDLAWAAWKAALAKPEAEAGVSWGGHNVRGDADSIAEVRRLIEFEDARQGTKPATVEDIRIYDAIAANYVNAQPASEPPESLPQAYLIKKLAMVMPLFEEARDALTAISEQQRAVRCISPTLADRMDMAGTYSIDDWRDVTPPTTEGE